MTPALWLVSRAPSGWYRVEVVVRDDQGPRLSRASILACSVAGARALMPVGVVPSLAPAWDGIVEAWAPVGAEREAA